MWRLGNIGAQLDDRKKERVQVLTLCPQALWENTDTESQWKYLENLKKKKAGSVMSDTLCALA